MVATLHTAVDFADSDGTVNVAVGPYIENLVAGKSPLLVGAGALAAQGTGLGTPIVEGTQTITVQRFL